MKRRAADRTVAGMTELVDTELTELKHRARVSWAAGDYDRIADLLWDVGDRIVQRVGVGPGEEVLDVACGTGNAAIRAAQAGGRVVGVDLAPELFDAADARAAQAGVEVEWVEGDAEALPYAAESFDVVLSTFGLPWVPRHEQSAREIARVLRPCGRFGLANWTPEGAIGEFFTITGAYAPPPPAFASPPALWGDERHVRELFADTGVELDFVRDTVVWRFDSLAHAVETFVSTLGPLVKARELLEPQGRWPALRAEIAAWFERWNRSGTQRVELGAEYVVVLGRKHGCRRRRVSSVEAGR
jgi:SAM-dependent methyltransferase